MAIKKFTLTDDAYIDTDNPTTNYASVTTIQILYNNYNLQMACLKCSPMLFGIKVKSARLALYCTAKGGTAQNISIYENTSDFSEATVTYNTKPTTGSAIDTQAPATALAWYYWTLTTATVQQWASGGNNYGLSIKQPASTGAGTQYFTFASSEYADSALRPYIEITYNPSGGLGYGNPWIFLKDMWEKHDRLWKPKLSEGYSY